MMKPVLKYPGAKWRLSSWILSYFPEHKSYLEPFFGSGAIFFNKQKATIETLNDIDGAIVQFFKTCREKPDELARVISMTPWAREEYQECDFLDNAPEENDIERARQFLVRCWMTFGARTRCKTGWRHTTCCNAFNHGPDNPKLWRRLPEVIYQVADRLLDAQIYNKPAIDVISEYNGQSVLIYADPPYLKETRTLNGDQYRYEMTDQDHVDLINVLKKHKGMVVLSGYENPLYKRELEGWSLVTKITTAERGVRRTEALWLNEKCVESLRLAGDVRFNQIRIEEVMNNV